MGEQTQAQGRRAARGLRLAPPALLLALLPLLPAGATRQDGAPLAQLPPRMVWAWERSEDLRWLPPGVGVAYVASTVELEGPRSRVRARAYPLLLAPDAALVPMVHVDASWREPPRLTAQQQAMILREVLRAAARGNRHVVQLDFEARRSQRDFYLALVERIRRELPADTALSVTALASWCAGDTWLAELPADEIVPMAFRMAADDGVIRRLLARDGRFPEPRCRAALGTATDEAGVPLDAARRYYFSPRSWSPETWQALHTRGMN